MYFVCMCTYVCTYDVGDCVSVGMHVWSAEDNFQVDPHLPISEPGVLILLFAVLAMSFWGNSSVCAWHLTISISKLG